MRIVPGMRYGVFAFAVCGLLSGGLCRVAAASAEPEAPAAGELAAAADNPYQAIASRNVFALKPPPPPPDPNAAPPANRPQIKLQGISSLFGSRRVLFKLVEKPGTEEALILKEGERYKDVEVVAIDPTKGTVRFNNQGSEVLLSMDKDAEKPPPGPAPGAPAVAALRPGAPTPMPVPTAGPGAAPGAPPPPIAAAGVVHLPPSGAAQPAGAPGAAPAPGLALVAGAGPSNQSPTAGPPPPPPLSREEQEVLIELNRLRYQQEGDPRAKLLPPTTLTPHLQRPPQPY